MQGGGWSLQLLHWVLLPGAVSSPEVITLPHLSPQPPPCPVASLRSPSRNRVAWDQITEGEGFQSWSEMAPTHSARHLGETTYGRGPQARRLTLQAEGLPTSLLPTSWRRKAVWPHLLSLSLLSPEEEGWGMCLSVFLCVHTGGIWHMGRGSVLPPP